MINVEPIPEKKKRGRKAKNQITENSNPTEISNSVIKYPKKRGRKPKGGKIITLQPPLEFTQTSKINIILHLKCGLPDIDNYSNAIDNNLENYKFSDGKLNELNYTTYNNVKEIANVLNTNTNTNNIKHDDNAKTDDTMKIIWQKLEKLSHNLHSNNICDKKSACFHCTYEFDNIPIYIPKYELNRDISCLWVFFVVQNVLVLI